MKKILLFIAFLGVIYLSPKSEHELKVVEKEKNTMLRDDFKKAIMFEAPEQVIVAIGRPDTTQQTGTTEYWYYHYVTRDPITGKVDYSAQVIIENGEVKSVNF